MKHYGFRGASGTKQAMSPKLYEAISEKFHNLWGEYAGWAHSVRLIHHLEERANCCLQVTFTADLKAFSDYGLLTPTPSPSKAATISRSPEGYLSAPIVSLRKRRIKQASTQDAGNTPRTEVSHMEGTSLAERIKKRRRITHIPIR